MDEQLTERLYQEELERVIGWWRRNGWRLVVAALVVLAAVLAWRWQQAREHHALREAALRYAAVSQALKQGRLAQADLLARRLLRDDGSSLYSMFAALSLARAELAAHQPAQVSYYVRWARRHPAPRSLRPLILFRLAEIELGLGRPKEALALLHGVDPGSYAVLFAMARAQAARALHQPRREFDELGLVATLAPAGSGWGRWARRTRSLLLPALTTSTVPMTTIPHGRSLSPRHHP